jgi:hypothetical protein
MEVTRKLVSKARDELNLHYIDKERRVKSDVESDAPSPSFIEQTHQMIYIGNFSARNKAISIENQREMVGWVIGTHQTLIQYYPQMAELFRQKHWVSWIDCGAAANEYQKEHLPYIAIKYASVLHAQFNPTANISP